MWPFSTGCGEHHYPEEPAKTWEDLSRTPAESPRYKPGVFSRPAKINLVEQQVYVCEHENCNKQKQETKKLDSFNMRKVEELLSRAAEHGFNKTLARIDRGSSEEIRRQHCLTLAYQIEDGNYDSLEQLEQDLKREGEKL